MGVELKLAAPEFLILGGVALLITGNQIPGWLLVSAGISGSVMRAALAVQQEKEKAEKEAEVKLKGYQSVVKAGKELGDILRSQGGKNYSDPSGGYGSGSLN